MSHDARQPTDLQPEGELSLDALTEAFAEVMGGGEDASEAGEKTAEASADSTDEGAVDEAEDTADGTSEAIEPGSLTDEACPLTPQSILEAMLFVGTQEDQGLSPQQAADLMRGVEPEEVDRLVAQLNERYARSGCPYTIVNESGRYRMALRKAFHSVRNRFYGKVREARLSQAAVDVLAIVAYQQPLSSEQVSRLRGKPCSHVLSQLVRRGLLRIERRGEKRRTPHYFTTDRFLELFGLESLEDLPQGEELDA